MGQGDGGYRIEETVEPTPERLAKGGLSMHYGHYGEYKSCTPEGITVLDWLAEREIVGPNELRAAHRYLACQAAFLRRSGAKVATWEQALGGYDAPAAGPNMGDDYTRILRHVSRAHCKTVEMAASTAFEEWLARPLWDLRGKIQEAFEALARGFESL